MRVMGGGEMIRVLRDERGVSAVVVAVSLVAVFGAAMLSIDAGNVWQERRNIITATDATALSEARDAALSVGSFTCSGGWQDLLVANAGAGVTPLACARTPLATGAGGYVSVEAEKPAEVRFGGVFNIGDTTAYSMSAARWLYAYDVSGLRPIGFCMQNQHVQEWLAHVNLGTPLPAPGAPGHPTSYPTTGVVHHMPFVPALGDGLCGSVPGNWGWMDFDGGSNPTGELDTWLRDGFGQNDVRVGDCNSDNAAPAEPCPGNTGAKSALDPALTTLIGKPIAIVVYDSATGTGSNSRFRIAGFLGVKLWGFSVNGAAATRYMDFEFTRIVVEPGRSCCSAGWIPAPDLGARVVQLCSVDHDSRAIGIACAS